MRHFRFPFDALRCDLKSPGQNQSDWKSENKQQNDQPHSPIWNFEERKYLRRNLDKQPGDDCVRDCHLVDIAALQLPEEPFWIHSSGFAIGFNLRARRRALNGEEDTSLSVRLVSFRFVLA